MTLRSAPEYHVPASRPPSYWHKQERRKAAKVAAGQGPIQAEQACVDIDHVDLEITVPAAEEATETENIASDEAEKVQEQSITGKRDGWEVHIRAL